MRGILSCSLKCLYINCLCILYVCYSVNSAVCESVFFCLIDCPFNAVGSYSSNCVYIYIFFCSLIYQWPPNENSGFSTNILKGPHTAFYIVLCGLVIRKSMPPNHPGGALNM